MQNALNHTELSSALSACRAAALPALVMGAPGIGKTDAVAQMAQREGAEMVTLYPATLDPTDVAGLPVPVTCGNVRSVERLLDDTLAAVFAADKPTVLLLDELGQAPAAVQAACAPLLLGRRIGKSILPDNVYVCATSNRRSDRAGANSILTHLVSRACVLTLRADLDEFCNYAAAAGYDASISAFLRGRPSLLHDFDAEKASAGTEPYACPRSWSHVSRAVRAGVDDATLANVAPGLIGEGAATEYVAFYALAKAHVDVDAALRDPKKYTFPKELSMRYALAVGVAYRAAEKTVDAVLTLAERMIAGKMGEFAALTVRDAFRAYPGMGATPAWIARAAGPLGAALRGA